MAARAPTGRLPFAPAKRRRGGPARREARPSPRPGPRAPPAVPTARRSDPRSRRRRRAVPPRPPAPRRPAPRRPGAGGRGPRVSGGRARRGTRRRVRQDLPRARRARRGPTRARPASTTAHRRSRRSEPSESTRSAAHAQAPCGRSAPAAGRSQPGDDPRPHAPAGGRGHRTCRSGLRAARSTARPCQLFVRRPEHRSDVDAQRCSEVQCARVVRDAGKSISAAGALLHGCSTTSPQRTSSSKP